MVYSVREYIEKLFKFWDIIDFIVSENSGGNETKEKVEWLKDVCAEYAMDSKNVEVSYFAEWIEQILNEEFDLILEDNSSTSVATNILKYSDALRRNDEELLNDLSLKLMKVIQERSKDINFKRQIKGNSDDEESESDGVIEEEMEVDDEKVTKKEKKSKQITDDDGWTTIQKK
uniref:Pre-rRNA-processing protein TSR2 homolog n=1 Tax=Parastrongyloides trichosuri TaxID=131310 RepID=A0A0N4ZR42_PARTI